ncbi:MAG: ABC transporter substrate-binding protein [Cyanophyceae cyanobacterium]
MLTSINIRKIIAIFLVSLALAVSCTRQPSSQSVVNSASKTPIILGYSSWAGWWPWAIAEREGLFAKHDANVQLKWYDSYLESMEALAAGQIDGNCQTLNDTISFAKDAVHGEVAVLVNDNSAGNDKIIAAAEIKTVPDLKGKAVAVEAGLVDDFLLSLVLEDAGMSRSAVEIVNAETGAAAQAFAAGLVDAVGAFPPFWQVALEREGAHELASSADYPGAIPDLLVVSQKLIDEQPQQVQALVDTWWDIREFMIEHPDQADAIMAERVGISPDDMQLFKEGTDFFTIEENLEAFSPGNSMKHMPFAAERMTEFMLNVEFIEEKPDLKAILDDRFVKAYAKANSS